MSKLSSTQVSKLVAGYVSATASESKSTVKRVRIVGALVAGQAGTQAAIATLLTDALGNANLSINLDTARAQVGHAVTASKLLQRFGLSDSDPATRAALSVSTGLIKSAVRDEAFKGISSDDMTEERFVGICTELKAVRKLKSQKPEAPAADAESADEETPADEDGELSILDDAAAVIKRLTGILGHATKEDRAAIIGMLNAAVKATAKA